MNQTRTLTLNLHIVEEEHSTTADVLLTTGSGAVLTGHGVAHRNARDTDVPEIGDELATSRALSQLAHKLLDTAAAEISAMEHRKIRLTH
jgi:Domain of unknown function (DUF1876)